MTRKINLEKKCHLFCLTASCHLEFVFLQPKTTECIRRPEGLLCQEPHKEIHYVSLGMHIDSNNYMYVYNSVYM